MMGIVRPNGLPKARRWAQYALPAATALCLALSGCASDDETAQASTATAEDFPNLASVPGEPPASTPKVEREKLIEGLRADRANAEYTGEQLSEAQLNVPPAEPPPPAPPKPEAAAESAAEDAADDSEPAEAEAAPAVTTPAEVAALPADLGEPTALIYFAGDTATLTDLDRAVLTDVAKMYTQQRGSRVRVIGHASSAEAGAAGTADGPGLAAARAGAVAQTLIALGVPANALETTTGGATYDESQPNGVAANRRVEVYIGS